jgi:hypothetical protein
LAIQTGSPFKSTVVVRAKTNGNKSNTLGLEVTVCGLESVSTLSQTKEYKSLKSGDSSQIDFSAWFQTSFDHSTSSTECTSLTYSLKKADCTTNIDVSWQSVLQVDSANKVIKINAVSSNMDVCLVAKTKGGISSSRQIGIGVCGYETVSLSNP